jgi:hypothetical protein
MNKQLECLCPPKEKFDDPDLTVGKMIQRGERIVCRYDAHEEITEDLKIWKDDETTSEHHWLNETSTKEWDGKFGENKNGMAQNPSKLNSLDVTLTPDTKSIILNIIDPRYWIPLTVRWITSYLEDIFNTKFSRLNSISLFSLPLEDMATKMEGKVSEVIGFLRKSVAHFNIFYRDNPTLEDHQAIVEYNLAHVADLKAKAEITPTPTPKRAAVLNAYGATVVVEPTEEASQNDTDRLKPDH